MADDYFGQFQAADNDYFNQFKAVPVDTPKPKKKTGVGGVVSDIGSGIAAVPSALAGMASQIPSQVADLSSLLNYANPIGTLMNQFGPKTGNEYTPERAARVAAAGLAKGGRGLLNIPGNTVDYLKEKELIPDWIQAARPESLNQRNYKRDAGVVGDRPGDELIEGGAAFAPNLAFGGPVAAGFAYGVGQNENPVTSALIPPALKGVGKVVKAIPTPLKSAKRAIGFKEATTIRENAAQTSQQLAEKIARTDLDTFQKTGGDMYTSLLDETKAAGITKAKIKKQLAGDFFKETTRKEKAAVRKAFETQDLNDIHNAYKDLGKYISRQSKKQLLTPERRALDQAKAIRKNMEGALKDAFDKAGGKPFAERFDAANKYWKENVIPLEGSELLNRYRAGKITPEDFIKKAARNETFRAHFAKKYPEIIEYADQLSQAEKVLAKEKPTTPAAKQLQKDVRRNEALTQTPRKVANFVAKSTGLGGVLNWLTK